MKKYIPLIFTTGLMVYVFQIINFKLFVQYISELDIFYLLLGLSLFIPQVFISSYRWKIMTSELTYISIINSIKLILASSTLNIFLPSKIGDFAKAFYLYKTGEVYINRGINIVLFERYIDLLAISLISDFKYPPNGNLTKSS